MGDEEIRRILRDNRVFAILGAHPEPHRAAFYVPDYLQGQGYTVLPVNPTKVGQRLWNQPVKGTLAELEQPVDLVDVFRPGYALGEHVDDILAMNPRPKVVWFQLGIRNDAVAKRLRDEGITVVQDRCTLADHRRLF